MCGALLRALRRIDSPQADTLLRNGDGVTIRNRRTTDQLCCTAHAQLTFRHVADRYRAEVIPTKAPGTQRLHNLCLTWLLTFFDDPPAPFEAIKPLHIRKYLDWRASKVIANREVALFSHLWNWARQGSDRPFQPL